MPRLEDFRDPRRREEILRQISKDLGRGNGPTVQQPHVQDPDDHRALPHPELEFDSTSVLDTIPNSMVKLSGMLNLKCVECGREFLSHPSRNRKFCSPECAYKNPARLAATATKQKKDRGSATCVGCGIVFKITTKGGRKYCSQPCAAKHIGAETIKSNRATLPAKTKVSKVCPSCGQEFTSWASAKKRFCCAACSANDAAGKTARVTAIRVNGRPDAIHSRSEKGWHEIGGQRIFARSRWEANYAYYLEFLKGRGTIQAWEHEPDTFWFDKIKRGVRSYLPDFKVTYADGSVTYHEVKGWMDPRSLTKIKRMAKYHPKVRMFVADAAWFKKNARTMAGLVPGWGSPALPASRGKSGSKRSKKKSLTTPKKRRSSR
jgi:hypothetical protein